MGILNVTVPLSIQIEGVATVIARLDRSKKSAGATPRRLFGIAGQDAVYAFMAPFTAYAVIGSERTRAPTALNTALPIAGATTVTAGSPTPVACSPLAMTLTATSGI